MGPQPLSRGNATPTPTATATPTHFNGAATSQSRKLRGTRLGGHYRGTSMGPQPLSRGNYSRTGTGTRHRRHFNGAATSQSRKHYPDDMWFMLDWLTSMGPQPLSRGNSAKAIRANAIRRTSMGPQPLSRGNEIWLFDALDHSILQWGRNLSVAETQITKSVKAAPATLQWGRNLSVAETSGLPGHPRFKNGHFNGAATSQSRKPAGEDGTPPSGSTSMGPQPLSRGNR